MAPVDETSSSPAGDAPAAPAAAPRPSLGERLRLHFARTYLTADLRSLAAGRIVLASVLLLDLIKRWTQIDLFYTNDGIIPNHTLLWRPSFDYVFSFFYMASYLHEAVLGFIVCLLAYTALLLGLRTKVAQVASMICMMSLHGRVLLFDNGGDVVLGLLTIWTTFLPTGRFWSVDAVLARSRDARARRAPAPEPFAVEDPARSFASLAVMALFCQLALIYFFNAIHKGGASWRNGSAVYYTLHLDRLATPFAVWLRGWLSPTQARVLTYSALGTESALPLLILCPVATPWCRRLAILAVLGLHAGFGLCMNLGVFVPAMMAYTPNLVPGEDWDRLARWWARGPRRARLWARACAWAVSLIERAADALSTGRRVVFEEPGRIARRWFAFVPRAREIVVLGFIFIATNQLFDENAAAHQVFDHHNARPVAALVTYLNLFQGWSMFAPEAPMTDFNIICEAVTVDGRHVDPFSEVATPRYPNPGKQLPPNMHPSWLFYGYENHLPTQPAYNQALQEWILRYPKRTGRDNDEIVSFEVSSVEDDSPPLGERVPTNLRSKVLFRYSR